MPASNAAAAVQSTYRDPNTVRWRQNASKRASDETLFRLMSYDLMDLARRRGDSAIESLSLPAATWAWERAAMKAFPGIDFRFVGLDEDPGVHRKLRMNSRRYGEKFQSLPKPCSVKHFVETCEANSFDIVYYDWMGTWSRPKKTDLDVTLARSILRPGGLLIMTVSVDRGYPETTAELEKYSRGVPMTFIDMRGRDLYVDHPKVIGIPQWVQERAYVHHDIVMSPVGAVVYYSDSDYKASPQINIIMRRDSLHIPHHLIGKEGS